MGRVIRENRGVRLCPECSGLGQKRMLVDGIGFTDWRDLECTLCKGRGELDERQSVLVIRGRWMRENRRDRGLTLVEEARRLGISPALLSRREWGRE